MNGKGDKNRSLNKTFRDGYSQIDWSDTREKELIKKLMAKIASSSEELEHGKSQYGNNK